MSDSGTPRRSALVGRLITLLQERIRSGAWPVGSRLPVEAELVEEFDVSRVTLRQAVQALVHVGLLETIQGNGTFVRATTELDAVLARFVGGEDMLTVLEARRAVESEAAGLAAGRADDADHARLATLAAEGRAALDAGDHELLNRVATRFHRAVVHAARNTLLSHFYDAFEAGATRSIMEGPAPQTARALVEEHEGICAAIRSGDAERAHRLARAHVTPAVEACCLHTR